MAPPSAVIHGRSSRAATMERFSFTASNAGNHFFASSAKINMGETTLMNGNRPCFCVLPRLLLSFPSLMLDQQVVLTTLASLNSLSGCIVIGYEMLAVTRY